MAILHSRGAAVGARAGAGTRANEAGIQSHDHEVPRLAELKIDMKHSHQPT